MTYDRSEIRSLHDEKRAERAIRSANAGLEWLRQAEVEAKNLMGDASWDRYLSYLQSSVDHFREQERRLIERLASPALVAYDAMLETKLAIAEARSAAKALEAAMSLPADIQREGENARSLTERLGQETE